jgi:hypothetical protein
MNTHDALIEYGLPVVEGHSRIQLDLFPAIASSFGEKHRAMVEHFGMVESNTVQGLVTLQAKCNQAVFLEFFGQCWSEAVTRWPTLAYFHQYRLEHGEDAYSIVSDWQLFYELVTARIEPTSITVTFTEHY